MSRTMADRLLPLVPLTLDDQLRFWDKFERRGPDECWLWTGSRYDGRYGRFYYNRGSYSAHRVSYYLHFGADPGDQLVCHECNRGLCVNPAHLFLGTTEDNQVHRVDSGRHHQEGDLNPQAKLRECDVIEILRALDSGGSRAALAHKHQVSVSLIHQIARGEIWRHLHG